MANSPPPPPPAPRSRTAPWRSGRIALRWRRHSPQSTRRARISPAPGPRLAFLFSGQGAHYAGMGQALHAAEPIFRAAFDRCAAVADALLGRSLLGLLDDAPALSQTGFAQPATFALQWALAELWASWGVLLDAVAGHSIGEFAAATVAGVLTPEAAMRLVIARAAGMQALPAGDAMAAVFTDVDTVRAALAPQETESRWQRSTPPAPSRCRATQRRWIPSSPRCIRRESRRSVSMSPTRSIRR
ncbi:acyltransferase domain-containing protein [Sphingomonas aurantiaca]|uniref:acyltransferase domain-containing protein n=1 Tax=Sphingomonas aurantiaca TaxID=185949 RepID=UPI002FDF5357